MSYPSFKAVLKRVRKNLLSNNPTSRYICVNIENVLEDIYDIPYNSILAERYKKKVESQLTGTSNPDCNSYEKWMKKYHENKYNYMTHRNFQEGRIQWIDHMLTRKDL